MKIKRLEIKGFKSFPDRTVLDLKPGITAIVGPNGCGKSNVMEAIRWVIGEQKVKSLRSKKMEDVIFTGSESRKPVGLAEVRLVLTNDGTGPAEMSDYDEIMIARRLFRDGASDYEINNVSCRLMDVIDFFLDTGVGKNSYAIIEQGRVDMIVASKPEDRRMLIEEAAGINRYKTRREAAEKRLEQTRQNLLRISDIVQEIKRQSNALKRQAGKAERYKKLSDQLRKLDIEFHAFKFGALIQSLTDLRAEIEENRANLNEIETESSKIGALIEEKQVQYFDTENSSKELTEVGHEIDLQIHAAKNDLEKNSAGLQQNSDQLDLHRTEISELKGVIKHLSSKCESLNHEETALTAELDELAGQLAAVLPDLAEKESTIRDKVRELSDLRSEFSALSKDLSQNSGKKEMLIRRDSELAERLAAIDEESISLVTRLENHKREKEIIGPETIRLKARLDDEKATRTAVIQSKTELKSLCEDLAARVRSAEKDLAKSKARLDVLEEMRADYQLYNDAVRFLMSGDRDADSGLIAPLAELIHSPSEFQQAVAAALEHHLDSLVVNDTDTAIYTLELLRGKNAGHATMIPLDFHSPVNPAVDGPRRLTNVISFDVRFEELIERFLGNYLVAEDLAEAVTLWPSTGQRYNVVTKAGEVIGVRGDITGGSQEHIRNEIFERQSEIVALEKEIANHRNEIEGLGLELESKQNELQDCELSLEDLNTVINEIGIEQVNLKKDLESLNSAILDEENRADKLDSEHDRLNSEKSGIRAESAILDKSVAEIDRKLAEISVKEKDLAAEIETLQDEAKGRQINVGDMRINYAKLNERKLALQREAEHAGKEHKAKENRSVALASEIERLTKKDEEIRESLNAAQENEKRLEREHEALSIKLMSGRQKTRELHAEVQEFRGNADKLTLRSKALRDRIHAQEIELTRLEETRRGVSEAVFQRHGIRIDSFPIPAAQPDEQEMAELQSKIESLGEVNLAAIAESKQIEERLSFLLDQEQDLKKAMDSLYATIETINKTTIQRFRAAFAAINEKFQEMFPFLFKGGEARLQLTDEENLLETGIEILARPPGKKIRNMDLLSGGEKAMTAVALIFSIFLTKPSPFCLLDEVDAPLDDANLDRFNQMLRKLSDRTQFLIITHNKRSMEEADSLCGVTMEEPGVSRVVSVEFAAVTSKGVVC